MYEAHKEVVDEFTIKIIQDEDPRNPQELINSGVENHFLVSFHNQFTVTVPGFMEPDDEEHWGDTHHVYPLNAYMHGGVSLSMHRKGQHGCPWDSCRVGSVLVCKTNYDKNQVTPEEIARGVIEEWNNYLSGDVWGYVIDDPDGDHADSIWGFTGSPEGYVLEEAKINVQHLVASRTEREKQITEEIKDLEHAISKLREEKGVY